MTAKGRQCGNELSGRDAWSVRRVARRAAVLVAVVAMGAARLIAADQAKDKPDTSAAQYQEVVKEFSAASRVIWEKPTDQERQAAVARVAKLPASLLKLVEKNPRDPIALEALIQVVSIEYWLNTHTSHPGWGEDSPQAKAIALMLRDHLDSDKLGEACRRVCYGFRQECETFLRTVLEKSPHREVQGQACLRLAQFLPMRLEKVELLKEQAELAKRYEGLYGKDYLETLRRQDGTEVMMEAEKLYERAIEKYADVKLPYDATVGETAKPELFEIRHLAVGKEAEEMEGLDQNGQQFRLSEYRGKVVLLYFWTEF